MGVWTRTGRVLFAVLLVGMFVGQALGQPFLVSFVTTGSMAPTLSPGDGFVAVPALVAGPVEPGDVITYRAETVGGGGLTTHRVVAETPGGYVTRGDANPFTDQSAGEPPVTDARIVAVALQVGGGVVTIPAIGTVATSIRGGLNAVAEPLAARTGLSAAAVRGLVVFALTVVAAFAVNERQPRAERDVQRDSGLDPRRVTLVITSAVVLSAVAAMVLPAGASAFEVVAAEADAPGPRVIPAGETEVANYTVANSGLVPIVSVVTGGRGTSVDRQRVVVGPRSRETVEVALHAPSETGLYRRTVVEHRYLAVLPAGVLFALAEIHPTVPTVVVTATLGGVTLLTLRLLLGRVEAKQRRRADEVDDRRS